VLSFGARPQIFLIVGPTDMRKSFDTLAAIVRNEIQKDPLTGQLFAFCNRRRNRVKILFFERGGLWLCAKRLEQGTFAWPSIGTRCVEMSREELSLLLSGIDAKQIRRRPWYERTTANN
jgi:transposase